MCTVTVHRASDRLLVTMNRDEARDRAPENSPVMHRDAIAWLAPKDSLGGGTWMAVNALGVVACLMNGYPPGICNAPTFDASRPTRGAIVPWLMARGGATEMRAALEHEFDPTPYSSFVLIIAHGDGVESFALRGGRALEHDTHDDEWTHFTSSSWKTEEVAAWRAREFEKWRAAGSKMRGAIPSLHLMQPEGKHEWSPLMDRERTCTRSITQIEIARAGAEAVIRYWPRDVIDSGGAPVVHGLPIEYARNVVRHG